MSYIRETCSAEITRSPNDCALFGWQWIEVGLGQFWARQKTISKLFRLQFLHHRGPGVREIGFGTLPFVYKNYCFSGGHSAIWVSFPNPHLSHTFEHWPQLISPAGGEWCRIAHLKPITALATWVGSGHFHWQDLGTLGWDIFLGLSTSDLCDYFQGVTGEIRCLAVPSSPNLTSQSPVYKNWLRSSQTWQESFLSSS